MYQKERFILKPLGTLNHITLNTDLKLYVLEWSVSDTPEAIECPPEWPEDPVGSEMVDGVSTHPVRVQFLQTSDEVHKEELQERWFLI